MIPLCEILDINVNELLSGKMLDKKEYNEKAEEILLELKKQEEEKDKIIFYSTYFLIFMVLMLFLVICFVTSFFISEEPIQSTIIIVSTILVLITCLYALKIEATVGYHECKECHHKYKPSYNQVLWSMHIGSTRYLKCPKCNKKSWSKKVISK